MKAAAMQILMVLTSHSELGGTGKKTGFWLEEFAAPYYVFTDADAIVTLASPAGGQPPLDPKSTEEAAQTASTVRFSHDAKAKKLLATTHKLSDIDPGRYDAVFYPGGHGPLWDLAEDGTSIRLIETFYGEGKPVAAVCHAPGVLRHARTAAGAPLVQGKSVTGFADSEEVAVGLSKIVPFLVEQSLRANGGHYSKAPDWHPHVVIDGNLITGQNPASSEETAKAVVMMLADHVG